MLQIDPATPSFTGGVAHVSIEAIGPADAPATTVAATVIANVSHRSGEPGAVPFAIEAPGPLLPSRHALRVWLDIDGRGPAARGDLHSTGRVAVAAPGPPLVVRLEDPAGGEREA